MTFFTLKHYVAYRRRAKTRHGIHSPFVYRFIDEGLRNKNARANLQKIFPQSLPEVMPRGERNLLSRIVGYFEANGHCMLLASPAGFASGLPAVNSDTIVIVPHIYKNPQQLHEWQVLAANPEVKMSIDLFSFGLLLFREEFKEKQHFVLKT